MPMTKAGLEDVVAANSAICDIIGPEGKLTYRGIDIHDLARQSSFEETTYLLWFGELPTRDALRRFGAELLDVCRARHGGDPGRHVLRGRVSHRRPRRSATWRRKRAGDEDAAENRRGRSRRSLCDRAAARAPEDFGIRSPGLPNGGSARHPPSADVA